MRDLDTHSGPASNSSSNSAPQSLPERGDVVQGSYKPVGKVDIAAIRREAQQQGSGFDKPEIVKGAYEPVGKVDIAAIRARAQPPSSSAGRPQIPLESEAKSSPDRSAPFASSERLTTLPKPKVSNRFGAGASSFAGTKAPTPGGSETKPTSNAPPMGAGRTFADSGGKTPAQLWAEKKASQQGSGTVAPASATSREPGAPLASQPSGDGQWKSGYQGKSWAPVQTTKTGQSAGSLEQQQTGEKEETTAGDDAPSAGGVGALRDRFKNAPLQQTGETASAPPPLDTSNKPNAGRGIPMPGLPSRPSAAAESPEEETPSLPPPPPQPPRSATPPTPPAVSSGSPIRIAMPVGRGQEVQDARDEQSSPPPAMPSRSLTEAVPHEDELEEAPSGHDPARAAATATAATTFGAEAAESARPGAEHSGKTAIVQYDYEKGEDNEIELKEGEHVVNIEMVDENWWMGENVHGESGLFPSNYVELIDDDDGAGQGPEQPTARQEETHVPDLPQHQASIGAASSSATATALYDYEAAEDNELSFPENAKITGIVSLTSPTKCISNHEKLTIAVQEFPDEDWWSGEYGGRQGLFPANYVQLDE